MSINDGSKFTSFRFAMKTAAIGCKDFDSWEAMFTCFSWGRGYNLFRTIGTDVGTICEAVIELL